MEIIFVGGDSMNYDMNMLCNKAIDFSIDIVKICNLQDKLVLPLIKPLLKSIEEMCYNLNLSKVTNNTHDIIDYIITAFQKAALTRYWLDLLVSSNSIQSDNNEKLIESIDDIILLIKNIIKESDSKYYHIINK